MSKVAKNPVTVLQGVTVNLTGQHLTVKGAKVTLNYEIHPNVEVKQEGNILRVAPRDTSKASDAIAGTTRAIIANMVKGTLHEFEKELEIIGVGYRAQVQGQKLILNVGHSHPVEFTMPAGITVQAPTNTKVIIKGANRYLVGEVAARIRKIRAPECYKGKGIRYVGERIIIKETKKK